MHDELRALCDPHGIFLRGEALRVGCTDRTLARARTAKVIHRIRHGAFVFASQWESMNAYERHVLTARAVVRQSRTRVVASHITAAIVHGAPFWRIPLKEVHLTRTDQKAGRRQAGVVQHRGVLTQDEMASVDGLLVTTPTRAALELTTLAGYEHSVPVLDDFLRRKLTTREELERGLAVMNTWSGTLSTRVALGLSDGRRESIAESLTFLMLWGTHLPRPEAQVEVLDETGHAFARLDFAWPEHGVWLEFDGKEKYLEHRRPGESELDAILRERKREERIARQTGWRCIRITWADLMNPERTVALIASVLAGGPVHR